VTLEVWDGIWHVWQAYAGYAPEAEQAIARVGAFIGQHLACQADKQ
jgi:epsilon-lactone hydrolase